MNEGRFHARSKHPAYPDRLQVPDDKVRWDVEWPEYKPTEFEHSAVKANDRTRKEGGWADPENFSTVGVRSSNHNYCEAYSVELMCMYCCFRQILASAVVMLTVKQVSQWVKMGVPETQMVALG